jgi:hypothetical protein
VIWSPGIYCLKIILVIVIITFNLVRFVSQLRLGVSDICMSLASTISSNNSPFIVKLCGRNSSISSHLFFVSVVGGVITRTAALVIAAGLVFHGKRRSIE